MEHDLRQGVECIVDGLAQIIGVAHETGVVAACTASLPLELQFIVFLHDLLALLVVVILYEVVEVVLVELREAKDLLVDLSHVVGLRTLLDVPDQVLELCVFGVFFKGRDWDAVVQLNAKGVHCVIHDDDVLQRNVAEDAQVFHVHVVCCLDTALAVEPVLDQRPVRVDVVQYGICVLFI